MIYALFALYTALLEHFYGRLSYIYRSNVGSCHAHHHKQIFLSHIKCRTKTVKFCHKIVPLIIPVILYYF